MLEWEFRHEYPQQCWSFLDWRRQHATAMVVLVMCVLALRFFFLHFVPMRLSIVLTVFPVRYWQMDIVEPLIEYFFNSPQGSALIYVESVPQAQLMTAFVRQEVHSALATRRAAADGADFVGPALRLPIVDVYTAKHHPNHREQAADDFDNDVFQIVVCTLAFSVVCSRTVALCFFYCLVPLTASFFYRVAGPRQKDQWIGYSI